MDAPEFEFLNESEGRQRGDNQALAPATEEQAANARLPDAEAATEDDGDIQARQDMDEDTALPAPQQQAEQVRS